VPAPAPQQVQPAPAPHANQCGFPHPPRKCGYPQPARVQDSNSYATWANLSKADAKSNSNECMETNANAFYVTFPWP